MNQFSDPPNTHDCYSFFPLDLLRHVQKAVLDRRFV